TAATTRPRETTKTRQRDLDSTGAQQTQVPQSVSRTKASLSHSTGQTHAVTMATKPHTSTGRGGIDQTGGKQSGRRIPKSRRPRQNTRLRLGTSFEHSTPRYKAEGGGHA